MDLYEPRLRNWATAAVDSGSNSGRSRLEPIFVPIGTAAVVGDVVVAACEVVEVSTVGSTQTVARRSFVAVVVVAEVVVVEWPLLRT